MEKMKIVLVDTDENYLMPLQLKFINGFGEKADIDVITDVGYLKEYFSTPRSIDLLVIQDELYDRSMERHDIANLFLLTEQPDGAATTDLTANQIYKYTSVKEIFNEVVSNISERSRHTLKTEAETRVIMVYSPVGGAGTTTTALGLCGALAKNHKSALYVAMDSLQSFGAYFPEAGFLPPEIEKQVASQNEYLYPSLKSSIRSASFDYIPPFSRALSSLNIKMSHYVHLINCVRASKDYNFIVLDTPSDFTEDVSRLMAVCDNILVITLQDRISSEKFDKLLQNLDTSSNGKFQFICNKYEPNEENVLVSDRFLRNCPISEYVGRDSACLLATAEALGELKELRKLAFLFI